MDKYKQKLIHALSDINTDGEVVRWIERNFPELRESEDERIRKWIVNLLHELHYNQTAQPMALKAIEYLEKQKEQKPAEWDKLQEDFRNINEAFEAGKKEVVANPEKYSLCKPAEWSEEDERIRKSLLLDYEYAMRGSGDFWKNEHEKKYNWLKSLRPSWKPSEEQMDALESAQLMYAHGLEREDIAVVLESLYQDLKKL